MHCDLRNRVKFGLNQSQGDLSLLPFGLNIKILPVNFDEDRDPQHAGGVLGNSVGGGRLLLASLTLSATPTCLTLGSTILAHSGLPTVP